MRKSLWIVPVLLLSAAIGVPNAHADSFRPTFITLSCLGACLPQPTAPDVSFPSPTTITVTWNGFIFLLPLPAPTSPTDSFGWSMEWHNIDPSCLSSCAGEAIASLRDGIAPFSESVTLLNVSSPGPLSSEVLDSGQLFFAPVVATPEPSSFALMFAGIWVLLVMRKRISQGLPQAS
jgi:hypothetical protein